jgi:hypothetical protein
MELENLSSAIVPINSKNISTIAISSEKVLEKLRSDREAHKHKQIWTKDAHGGPYRKVGAALCRSNFIAHLSSTPLKPHVVILQANEHKGYDPLIEHPDGTKRTVSNSCPETT